jgi:hypothetical protein
MTPGHQAMGLAKCLVGAGGLAMLLALAGCGSSSHTSVTNRLVSKDQELTDLQRAYEFGALNRSEYEQQRRKIQAR